MLHEYVKQEIKILNIEIKNKREEQQKWLNKYNENSNLLSTMGNKKKHIKKINILLQEKEQKQSEYYELRENIH